ncbi:MSMEG_0565 family glycosyltransferase [Pseudonocardia sp.]|uniref:MSMEG_0565 family glycosyltransferase n=1 Tax=Pseudonocardia sp. TaxID=60912 RepID=UPI00260EC195|nr:MSMEG_0565 family glycosyltransferase [Pseudonocardia sp.]
MSRGVALLTYSTKPRGGVVHTLCLAEELHRQGYPVHVVTLGDPDVGFFRPVDVPHTIVPVRERAGTLDERVFDAIDALTDGLRGIAGGFDILHPQDCISARAAVAVRDEGAPVTVVRTVHHVDDFTTHALIDCQAKAIHEPDRVLVVSEQWRGILRDDYGVTPEVVPNGVDTARFPEVTAAQRTALRERVGARDRFLLLAVGGVEPRKGTHHLFEALGSLATVLDRRPVLAVVGGHSFQDYTAYRDAALASLPSLGLELGVDVVQLGTVDEAELAGWYSAADALAFPSVKEGWGLVVLEALSMGLPVVASDLPVFGEYLTDGVDALLPAVGDSPALAAALHRIVTDGALRDRLRTGGHAVAQRYTWAASAQRHREVYADVRAARR